MPEGPEIRLEADKIGRAVAGRPTTKVWFAFEELHPDGERLTGQTVESVTSKGKALLTRFDDGTVIYSHNQLYGRWYVKPAGETPKTGRQLRLLIETEKKAALLYSASEIEVLFDDELDDHHFVSKLGPDPLDDVSQDEIAERLRSDTFHRRQLAALLLDQSFVAGLGNYLRAEILHTAAIAPKRKAKDLSDAETETLASEILRVTRQSYETKGITNDLERVEQLKQSGLTRSKYRHHVYRRDGLECYRCGNEIERKNVGGRGMFFCPNCQV